MSERLRRAFLPEPPAAGGEAVLDPEESHHVARVLRLRPGDALSVFDGRGGEWDAVLEAVAREGVSVRLGKALAGTVESALSVVLLQSLIRPEKLEWVLQKGTELGIAGFRLIPASRAEAPPPAPSRLDRYRRIVLEAVKQSGRRVVPPVEVGPLVDPPEGTAGILLDPADEAPPLGALLLGRRARGVFIAVGPEGGFDATEVRALADRGWRRARLGPRVLRTETAGAIAAALVLHAWGDLGSVAGEPALP